MELLSFSAAKDSGELANVVGVCSSTDQFKSYLNQAVRKIMRRGNWFGTVQKIRVCVYDNCITWPRYVGTVLANNVSGHHVQPQNLWWSFLPILASEYWSCWGNIRSLVDSGRCWGNATGELDGTTPVFRNIPCGQDMYVRAWLSWKGDAGKTITIFGIDGNGQEIYTTRPDGTFQPGVVLTLAVPYTVTPFQIRKITRVLKQPTQGIVRLYAYDGTTLYDVATYDPSELSPNYTHEKLHGVCVSRACGGVRSIEALIKLEFVPVVNDSDLVLIENLDAIALMIQSQREKDAGHLEAANGLEGDCFRENNYSLRDRFPIEQFVSTFQPFGTARLERITGGFI